MGGNETNTLATQRVESPDRQLVVHVGVDTATAQLWYEVERAGAAIVSRSHLAVYDTADRNLLAVSHELSFETATHDETWEQPWGEQRYVRNHYNELAVGAPDFTVRFRVFNDGLGFRYELAGEGEVTITREATEFMVPSAARAWWIPALGQNHYEHLYKKTSLQDMGIAHTPLTLELPDGSYAALHEAALYDYGALNIVPHENGLISGVTPLANGTIGRVNVPFTMPWRTLIFADTAAALMTSRIMLNLNEPSAIADTSWITPTKFMGIWWGMFIGYMTWGSGPNHGATTVNAFRYINACKKLGIPALLIEGWNEGWDGDWTKNGDKMKHLQPYADFDIHAITAYAKSQGVAIIGHHETSGNVAHYEWELPEAYDYYRQFDVRYVKTGYVSPRLNGSELHSSQFGVQHYQKTVEMAAERQMMLDIHEPVRGTGIERTWPNLLTREGVMGQEYEGGAISPEHAAVLPFTRSLSGPLDYTPGLFNLSGTRRKVHSTLAKQLAFYVTLFSPMHMVADIPEHYVGHPAFQFIRDVPVIWEQTVPLDGVIGDFFAVARKDWHSDDWYIGAVTDENARELSLALHFLMPHRKYTATIYRDAADADWKDNPEAYAIETIAVTSETTLTAPLAAGGGYAVRISPEDEVAPPYSAWLVMTWYETSGSFTGV